MKKNTVVGQVLVVPTSDKGNLEKPFCKILNKSNWKCLGHPSVYRVFGAAGHST